MKSLVPFALNSSFLYKTKFPHEIPTVKKIRVKNKSSYKFRPQILNSLLKV